MRVKPHPNSSEHSVVTFKTKVDHEICIDNSIVGNEFEIEKQIVQYLEGFEIETVEEKVRVKGYEDVYPETSIKKEKEKKGVT